MSLVAAIVPYKLENQIGNCNGYSNILTSFNRDACSRSFASIVSLFVLIRFRFVFIRAPSFRYDYQHSTHWYYPNPFMTDEASFFYPVAGETDFAGFAIGLRAEPESGCGFTVVWFDFEMAERAGK